MVKILFIPLQSKERETFDQISRNDMKSLFNIFRKKRTWLNDSKLWRIHVAEMQAALDAERANGYGYRYIDGRRIDF